MDDRIVYQACVLQPQYGETLERGTTPRTHRLAMDACNRFQGEFDEFYRLWEAWQPLPEDGPITREMKQLSHTYRDCTPWIREDELLVGARRRIGAELVENDGVLRYDKDKTVFNQIANGYRSGEWALQQTPPDRLDILQRVKDGLVTPICRFGHKTVDFGWVIRTGSLEIINQAQMLLDNACDDEARDVARAYIAGHTALIEMAEKYAQEAECLAAQAEEPRKTELIEIARVCRRVPAYPAQTYREAVQCLWFSYMHATDSIGHPDLFLYSYYEADRKAGRLTRAEAVELTECLYIKMHADYLDGFLNVSSYQTVTLAGQLPDGTDASNELTRIFLEAVDSVALLRPATYIRCFDGTPDDLYEIGVRMLAKGLGQPSFYGDKGIVKALERMGIDSATAKEYSLGGCAEVCDGYGRGNWSSPSGWFNTAKIVDTVLRAYANEDKAFSFEELWSRTEKAIMLIRDDCMACQDYCDEHITHYSARHMYMMPCCLELGKTPVTGGTYTRMSQWSCAGLANAADMLLAAKILCGQQGESLKDLYARIDAGDEILNARLIRLPHFGNGDQEADAMAAALAKMISDRFEEGESRMIPYNGLSVLSLAESIHVEYGACLGATLDGRQAGKPIADSLVGGQGRNQCGPTAVVQSLCAVDHSCFPGGTVATLRLNRSYLKSKEQLGSIAALVKTYVRMGGSQMQINFLDTELLREAQRDPIHHEGIIVRISGYAADFVHVDKQLQDEIISRGG